MYGPNGIDLCRIIEEELMVLEKEAQGIVLERPTYEINEMLPEEAAKIEENLKLEEEYREAAERLRVLTLAAHTFQLDEKSAREALYMSDVDPNEACLHALLNGRVLVVLFKMFETDSRDFVKLMRYALYEEIPVPKEDVPPEKQVPLVPAYERYATITDPEPEPTPVAPPEGEAEEPIEGQETEEGQENEQVEEGENEKEKVDATVTETVSEVATTLTDTTPADTVRTPTRPIICNTGDIDIVINNKQNPDEIAAEEKVEEEEEFNSDIEVEGEEYIPPGGLFQVMDLATVIETEYLPPHVLVIFTIDKRHDVQEVTKQYPSEILNMGVFVGEDPYNAEHVAYTIKQYDKMDRPRRYHDRLALMVSRKRSLPLLQLAGLNPVYISADVISGERECLAMFPVGYGDDHVEIESVKEEELVEVTEVSPVEVTETPVAEAKAEDKEEDEDEDGEGTQDE
ncbi:hypothetical protein HF086_017845 [Spodoptera exigua]|uniref:DUF4746 domain-containing protein n=1 Tax=Spodoptera exigua TaxID=7107 RepID=A0A922SLG3_SPOEX|nr:hypothetical protein HF086_017845 [Spodoptera exigua]